MNKQQYPVGKEIVWSHPSDGSRVTVKVVGYEKTNRGLVVNVVAADFKDGALVSRLESDGTGLK